MCKNKIKIVFYLVVQVMTNKLLYKQTVTITFLWNILYIIIIVIYYYIDIFYVFKYLIGSMFWLDTRFYCSARIYIIGMRARKC